MDLIYHHAVSINEPLAFEITMNQVFIRKNIKRVEIESESDTKEYLWVYDEASMPKDFALIRAFKDINKLKSDIDDGDNLAIDHEYRLVLLELDI